MHAPFPGFGPETLAWFDGPKKGDTRACSDRSPALRESEVRDPPERLAEDSAGRRRIQRAAPETDGRAPVAFARSLRDRSRPVMERMDARVGSFAIPPDARLGTRA